MRGYEELHFGRTTVAGLPIEEKDHNRRCYDQKSATDDFVL